MKTSFFKNATEGIPVGDWYITQILEAIKNGRWAELVQQIRTNLDQKQELKKRLPAFTPSGTFKNWRSEKNFVEHSGLICIDFDNLDMPDVVMRALSKNKYTFACFVSVSGRGVAWLVKIDAFDKASHLTYFFALEKYVKLHFNLDIDKSCKNLDRLRFVSHDPHLYFWEHSQVFDLSEVPPELPKKKKTAKPITQKSVEQSLNGVLKYAQKKGLSYVEGQRHNYIVCTAGLANQIGISLADYLSCMNFHFSDFDDEKAEKIYKKYATQFNTKS